MILPLLALLAAFVGGVMNGIAGGGTLVTFPAIIALGLSPLVANATSTIGLLPGAAGSMWGYRSHLAGARPWVLRLTLPSFLGGAAGALLLLRTGEERFAAIVPFLVLGATVLFMCQGPLMRRLGRAESDATPAGLAGSLFFLTQFLVGIYGGYFGAGVGILMLASFGILGLRNIHRMNGLKNWGGLCMNLVAAGIFVFSGIVDWPVALAMAVGGLLGGYTGSRVAQRVGEVVVRGAVVGIGLASFVWLYLRPI